MTIYTQHPVNRGGEGYYAKFCGVPACHRPAFRRESILGHDTLLCRAHAKASRLAWNSALNERTDVEEAA